MIFDFLKKQKEIDKKRDIIKVMIKSLNIPEDQKKLYLEAMSILDIQGLEKLYISLTNFIKEIELENLDNINKQNFYHIA